MQTRSAFSPLRRRSGTESSMAPLRAVRADKQESTAGQRVLRNPALLDLGVFELSDLGDLQFTSKRLRRIEWLGRDLERIPHLFLAGLQVVARKFHAVSYNRSGSVTSSLVRH